MKRFVSVESYDGEVKAYSESDNFKEAIDNENTACWVWQFAESRNQAIEQHYTKHEEWEKNPELETY